MHSLRTAVLGLLTACAVTVSPVVALAETGSAARGVASARVAGPEDAADRARAALAAVERAFDGSATRRDRGAGREHADRHLTLLLRDLRLGLDELDGEERERAESYLARPTGPAEFRGEPQYGAGAAPADDCTVAPTPGSHVCVTWATATSDAPVLTDSDGDGVPDYVETTRDVLNDVWDSVVVDGGYRAPLPDAASDNAGPDGRLDVYLLDIGDDGFYGYCTTDDPDWRTTYAVSAYCVLDDDFATHQFGGVPTENLQVTAAHEFFHAVQYAYDWTEDVWLLEGTAAWVEDELYDDVDDNRQYLLSDSPLSDPQQPLDGSRDNPYASWIFWRYLGERFPDAGGTGLPLVVRDVIERAGGASPTDSGTFSTQALRRSVEGSFPKLFSRFAVANRRPRASYEEGAAYRAAPLAGRLTLRNRKAVSFASRPAHLAAHTVRVKPGPALKGKRWRLRVQVEMPRRSFGYDAALTTVAKDGSVSTRHVRLKADGDGSRVAAFGRARVRYVEVTLTNASTRYVCWQGRQYACEGTPKDDGRRVKATVKAFR